MALITPIDMLNHANSIEDEGEMLVPLVLVQPGHGCPNRILFHTVSFGMSLGLRHGPEGAGADDVEGASGHFGTGETGPMVREAGFDVVHGRSGAADDADAVAFFPGQVQAGTAFGHGKARPGDRLFRQRGADGHHGAPSGGRILFADASRQDGKGQSQR